MKYVHTPSIQFSWRLNWGNLKNFGRNLNGKWPWDKKKEKIAPLGGGGGLRNCLRFPSCCLFCSFASCCLFWRATSQGRWVDFRNIGVFSVFHPPPSSSSGGALPCLLLSSQPPSLPPTSPSRSLSTTPWPPFVPMLPRSTSASTSIIKGREECMLVAGLELLSRKSKYHKIDDFTRSSRWSSFPFVPKSYANKWILSFFSGSWFKKERPPPNTFRCIWVHW